MALRALKHKDINAFVADLWVSARRAVGCTSAADGGKRGKCFTRVRVECALGERVLMAK
jgi:hypothetical protein